ncbi:MAG: LysM peptidoglycan-binding domain-containing protein [Lysinibacillus sp.]
MKKWQFILSSAALAGMLAVPVAEASTYTVQKGDTLSKIAIAHGTTIASLKAWNKMQQDTIYVDQKLVVANIQQPAEGGGPTSGKKPGVSGKGDTGEAIKPGAATSETYTYSVVKGDSLTKIASQNNTTVAKLKEWNGLSSDAIYVNQKLLIKKEEPALNGTNSSAEAEKPTGNADQEIAARLAMEKKITVQPSAASREKYAKVIETARALIGTPYVYGGNTPLGFDCSGFVSHVYSNAATGITRKSSLDYFMNDTTVVANPIPGDVVFFKNTYIATISHMGIYIGNNEFIHAGTNGVEISKLSYDYWDTRLVAYKRFNSIK